jgi:hypothetical protein
MGQTQDIFAILVLHSKMRGGVKEIKRKIRRCAGEFIKTRKGDFDFMARMGDDQILFNDFDVTRVQDIAIRHAFIEYMINLTRNATTATN